MLLETVSNAKGYGAGGHYSAMRRKARTRPAAVLVVPGLAWVPLRKVKVHPLAALISPDDQWLAATNVSALVLNAAKLV